MEKKGYSVPTDPKWSEQWSLVRINYYYFVVVNTPMKVYRRIQNGSRPMLHVATLTITLWSTPSSKVVLNCGIWLLKQIDTNSLAMIAGI